MIDGMKSREMRLTLQFLFLHLGIPFLIAVEASSGKWDVMNCNQVELSYGDSESILLDAKRPLDEEQCIAIKDQDYGDYKNYEIEVDILSLESVEGQNTGNVGVIFNYLDSMNYDFIYLEIHDTVPTPPTFSNQSKTVKPTFNTGYRLHGDYYYDEKIVIDQTVDGSSIHSLRLVVDNDPGRSTKVFLDGSLVGTFQEHFVPRLKGGVFVTHRLGSVGLFRSFQISTSKCNVGLDSHGNCEVAEVFYKGFGGHENPSYAEDCNIIPSNAIYIKIVMGSIVDYFKPVEGKSYCEMLQSHKLHQWSSDGKNWMIPLYYHHLLGGSDHGYPTDGRGFLSFWGGNGANGGCCHHSYSDGHGWNRAFNIFYGIA